MRDYHAMDSKLKTILSLYGESTPPVDSGRDPDEASLREVKAVLDDRPRVSAPESVIRDVLESASIGSRQVSVRRDRAPAGRLSRRLAVAASGISFAFLMLAGVLVFMDSDRAAVSPEPAPAIAEIRNAERDASPAVPADAESPALNESAPAAFDESPVIRDRPSPRISYGPPVQVASARSIPAPAIDERSIEALSWDDSQDLRELHQMIDVLQSRGHDIDWDEPAVPLELLPEAGRGQRSGVRQAGFPGNGRNLP